MSAVTSPVPRRPAERRLLAQPPEDPTQAIQHQQRHGLHKQDAAHRTEHRGLRRAFDRDVAAGIVDGRVQRRSIGPLDVIRRRIDRETDRKIESDVLAALPPRRRERGEHGGRAREPQGVVEEVEQRLMNDDRERRPMRFMVSLQSYFDVFGSSGIITR